MQTMMLHKAAWRRQLEEVLVMTIQRAIRLLREQYKKALEMPHIEKPLAWALYQVWQEANRKEKKRK